MFLITGITGHVGGAAAKHLLAAGKQVRALVRDKARASAWSAQGVELLQGEWQDSDALARAFEGVEGAYLMMPPSQTPSPDFREAKAVVASYQKALASAAPPKLVALSSMGSDRSSGVGLITSAYLLEEGLRDLTIPTAVIRAGSFFENYLYGLQAGQGGTLPTFYTPTDRELPMIASEDIGAEVASLLTSDWTGKRIIELGTLLSPEELAAAIGKALHRDVKAQPIPREAWAGALEQMGVPKGSTWAFEEMTDAINSGWIAFGIPGTEHVDGTTSAEQFFAAANSAQSAS
jgi:uncharacterized protein YbjT (DUF2867 family)